MAIKTPWEIAGSVVDSLIGLGREVITDKDKLIEFQFKALELKQQMGTTLLNTQTIPWVDALVKLMYAFIALARPIGAAAMTAFGMYAHYKGIDIDTASHLVLDGAFPAWGASRHANKHKEMEEETKRRKSGFSSWEE